MNNNNINNNNNNNNDNMKDNYPMGGPQNTEELKEDYEERYHQFKTDCGGIDCPGDSYACHMQSEYELRINKKKKLSSDIFQNNCHNNQYMPSCFYLGRHYLLGTGRKRNILLGLNYLKYACENNFWPACYFAGRAIIETKNMKHFPYARQILRKACENDERSACQYAGELYLLDFGDTEEEKMKNENKKDINLALKLLKKGCDMQDMLSCAVLGHLYSEKGAKIGVESNEEQSKLYFDKSKSLKENFKKLRNNVINENELKNIDK